MHGSAATDKRSVPIVFCADGNYGQYLTVAVQSIIENSSAKHEYHIIIFDCGIGAADLEVTARQIAQYGNFQLKIHDITARLNEHKPFLKLKGYWSLATYGRFFIPKLCSDYSKVIYADIDMVFNRDIAELMAVDLGDNYIAGVPELIEECKRQYDIDTAAYLHDILHLENTDACINAGLVVFNNRQWITEGLAEKAFYLLREKNLRLLDQDAINSICRGNIFYLDFKWNCLTYPMDTFLSKNEALIRKLDMSYLNTLLDDYYTAFADKKAIIHYNQPEKPWNNVHSHKADLWWYYAEQTPPYQFYLRSLLGHMHDSLIQNLEKFSASLEEKFSFFGIPLFTVKRKSGKCRYYFLGIRIAKRESIRQ